MKLIEGLDHTGKEIENIVFDWGGVLTDLHFERTVDAFHKLGFSHFGDAFPITEESNFFLLFELGKINESEFLKALRTHTRKSATDEQLLEAWNLMLGDFPLERWQLLEQIKKHYRLFLLSNTNSLHVAYYYKVLQHRYGTYGYSHFFEKLYFSHQLGMRKPNPEIYAYLLHDSRLQASSTLFIDDSLVNIEAAGKLGIKGVHLAPPRTLTGLFTY